MKPVDEMTPEERRRAGRIVGWTCLVFFVALYVWQTRGELGMSVPALLLGLVCGSLGVGVYRIGRRLGSRGRSEARMPDLGFVLSATFSIALCGASAAWISGEWLGAGTAIGSVAAGFTFAFFLWFARLAVQGLPATDGGSRGDASRDSSDVRR